jgi:hypothetical protein
MSEERIAGKLTLIKTYAYCFQTATAAQWGANEKAYRYRSAGIIVYL